MESDLELCSKFVVAPLTSSSPCLSARGSNEGLSAPSAAHDVEFGALCQSGRRRRIRHNPSILLHADYAEFCVGRELTLLKRLIGQ